MLNFIEVFSYCVLLAALEFLMYTVSALNSQRSTSFCPFNIWINMQHHVGPDFFFFAVKVMFWQWWYHWCWWYSFLYFVFIFCKCAKQKLHLNSLRCCLWLWAVSEYMLSIGHIEALSRLIIPFLLHNTFTFLHLLSALCYPQGFRKTFNSNADPYLS